MTVSAERLVDAFRETGLRIATVESCTGGLVAAAITDVPGSSAVLDRGFVTYSNEAKSDLVGVPAALIQGHGAVSEAVALAMARGGFETSAADVAVAVTGIAGPGGGSTEKPVGLVHFAIAWDSGELHRVERFGDLGRAAIRQASVEVALDMLDTWCRQRPAAGVPEP